MKKETRENLKFAILIWVIISTGPMLMIVSMQGTYYEQTWQEDGVWTGISGYITWNDVTFFLSLYIIFLVVLIVYLVLMKENIDEKNIRSRYNKKQIN